MPYYIWAANYSTASATVICPQWTTSTTGTISVTTAGTNLWQPAGNITTSGYVLEPAWQWGWHPDNQPRTLQEAYEPPTRAELDRMREDELSRQRERQAARARVSGRAEALLRGLLDDDQIASYFSQGWFEVIGSAGGRYRINRNGQAGNVDEMPAQGDHRTASLCIHPYGGFHDADAHAAQYLALVTDEAAFRRTANRTPRRRLAAA